MACPFLMSGASSVYREGAIGSSAFCVRRWEVAKLAYGVLCGLRGLVLASLRAVTVSYCLGNGIEVKLGRVTVEVDLPGVNRARVMDKCNI